MTLPTGQVRGRRQPEREFRTLVEGGTFGAKPSQHLFGHLGDGDGSARAYYAIAHYAGQSLSDEKTPNPDIEQCPSSEHSPINATSES